MKVNQVVKIKSGAHRGLVGVVEAVCEDVVTVRIEGVREGAGFVKVVKVLEGACEVKA